jgi:membrane fusion protein
MNEAPDQRHGQQGLFRSVAVQAAAGSDLGEPLRSYWRGVAWFTVLAIGLVAGLFTLATKIDYVKVHRVRAYVDSRNGLVRIAAPADGRIAQLSVKEGDRVEAGALLAVLSSDKLGGDGGNYRRALLQRLDEEKAGIEREISAAEAEARAQEAVIVRRLTGMAQERVQAQADIASAARLLQSLREQAERLGTVAAAGYATRSQLDQKRDEVNAQESRLANARSLLARIDRDTSTAQAERGVVEAKLVTTVEGRRRAAREVDRLILQSTAEAEQTVRSAQGGVVSAALISSGQSVVAGQALFTLSPADDDLIVRVLIPARSVGAAKPGVPVRIAFHAYPQERFGSFEAKLESVSATAVLPADGAGVYGAASEPMFVGVASIERELRLAGGEAISVKPGMLADALISLEQRTVLAWLLEPVLRGFNDAAGRLPVAGRSPEAR